MARAKTKEAETLTLLPLDDSRKPDAEQAKRPAPKVVKQRTDVAVRQPNRSASVAKVTHSESPLALLAALSRDPTVQPEKMREILAMQKEIRAEEARMAFTRAKIAMSEFLPVIDENGTIDVPAKPGKTGYKRPHAKMIDINKAIKPLLRQYGFDLWFEPGSLPDGRVSVIVHLDHVEGYGITGLVPMSIDVSGGKNNQQGVGSSMRYAQRYGTIQVLNIDSRAPQDQDDDGKTVGRLEKQQAETKTEVVEVLTAKQTKDLRAAIEDSGVPEETFCSKYEIEKIEELSPKHLAQALGACAGFKAERMRREQASRGQNG